MSLHSDVTQWLQAHWDPNMDLLAWRTLVADSGWGAPSWPSDYYGKDMNPQDAKVVEQAFADFGAVGAAQSGVRMLAAITLLAHGNHEQKQKYLRGILTGEDQWCQLFSEPGSGSDLAGATTRADPQGDKWIVNGQKVWNTSAHHAQYGLLLARTDWGAPKHQGLSYFVINMEQPGIEVRQLAQMNGHASFNEVFMTDAIVSRDDLVGALGSGWQYAMTTLASERRSFDRARDVGGRKGRQGKIFTDLEEEFAIANAPYTWYPQRAGRVDLVMQRAMDTGAIDDPAQRQDIARLHIMAECAKWTGERAKAADKAGKPQGPEGSLGKLAASNVARLAARVHTAISGSETLLTGNNSPMQGIIAEVLVSTPAISIAGGTDEIQKNIIAERVMGLPKEPRFDEGPFRDIRRNSGPTSGSQD